MSITKKKRELADEVAKDLMLTLDYENTGLQSAFADIFASMQNKTVERFQSLLKVVPPPTETEK